MNWQRRCHKSTSRSGIKNLQALTFLFSSLRWDEVRLGRHCTAALKSFGTLELLKWWSQDFWWMKLSENYAKTFQSGCTKCIVDLFCRLACILILSMLFFHLEWNCTIFRNDILFIHWIFLGPFEGTVQPVFQTHERTRQHRAEVGGHQDQHRMLVQPFTFEEAEGAPGFQLWYDGHFLFACLWVSRYHWIRVASITLNILWLATDAFSSYLCGCWIIIELGQL